MSKNTNPFLMQNSITRRTFLKTSIGAGLLLVAAQGAAASLFTGCAAAPTADLIITSSLDFNHSHKVTIPGAAIQNPPSEGTYISDGPTHTHAITLAKADFDAINGGQTVTKTSTATGTTPHSHTFAIKKA